MFCRGLSLDDQASAAVMHLLWEVLDILNGVSADVDQMISSRYKILENGLKQLYSSKVLT